MADNKVVTVEMHNYANVDQIVFEYLQESKLIVGHASNLSIVYRNT